MFAITQVGRNIVYNQLRITGQNNRIKRRAITPIRIDTLYHLVRYDRVRMRWNKNAAEWIFLCLYFLQRALNVLSLSTFTITSLDPDVNNT